MIDGKTVLAVIPARGGSKGIKGKNMVEVCGRPLLAWTIEQAKASNYVDRVILSSEDEEIIKTAREYDCEVPFIRPIELATDTSPTIDCIHHAMDNLGKKYDYLVLLQVTSPLRTPQDIDNCISICHVQGVPSCISFTEADSSPYWMYEMLNSSRLVPIIKTKDRPSRRQDAPKCYVKNGAVYVAKWGWLRKSDTFETDEIYPYIMPKERSLDIDSPFDIVILDAMMKKNRRETIE